MQEVRVSSNYRITIPDPIRSKLRIVPGRKLDISEADGAIVLTPIPLDPVEFLCGIFKDQPSVTEELLAERKLD